MYQNVVALQSEMIRKLYHCTTSNLHDEITELDYLQFRHLSANLADFYYPPTIHSLIVVYHDLYSAINLHGTYDVIFSMKHRYLSHR